MKWVVTEMLPFNFCESEFFREYTKFSKISAETLAKRMVLVAAEVCEKIKDELPKWIAIEFDGHRLWKSSYWDLCSLFS